jgi:hypothetical protein
MLPLLHASLITCYDRVFVLFEILLYFLSPNNYNANFDVVAIQTKSSVLSVGVLMGYHALETTSLSLSVHSKWMQHAMVPEIALTTRKGAISLYGMSFPSKMEWERTLHLLSLAVNDRFPFTSWSMITIPQLRKLLRKI